VPPYGTALVNTGQSHHAKDKAARRIENERIIMNKQSWGGIIAWGIFVTCVGLGAINPTPVGASAMASAGTGQEMIFLLAGGLVTCLIGLVGLIGFTGWLPRAERQPGAVLHALVP